MESIVQQKIDKEVREGQVLRPFPTLPLENLRVSPLGIVPKKALYEFCLIHHLSFPEGISVNDAIPQELCTVRYTSFDEAVNMIRKYGVEAELAKCDIKSGFRLLPVHPHDFNLLGFQFAGAFYVDRALPMGCSVLCAAFEKFNTFIEWKIRSRMECNSTAHYLDDFLFCGKRRSGRCAFILNAFQILAKELGLLLAEDKTEGLAPSLTFLGIELNMVQQLSLIHI